MVFFIGATGSTTSTVTIPTGTTAEPIQVGDTLILTGHSDTDLDCTDPRMTPVGFSATNQGVWWGIYDGDNTPISVSTSGTLTVSLTAWRSPGIAADVAASGVEVPSYPMPTIEGTTKAVAAVILSSGIVDGTAVLPDGYAERASAPSYTKTKVAVWSWEGDPADMPDGDASFSGSRPTWRLAVLRLNPLTAVAPPCRLFPRSDGLGVGSGRHYPPAKSQQRSGRRFGYY